MCFASRHQTTFVRSSWPELPVALAAMFATLFTTSMVEAQVEDELTLAVLMDSFSALGSLSAEFHETQNLTILRQPLEYEGTVHFVAPGRFVRHTTSPLASSVLIDGSRLEFGDEYSADALDLQTAPAVRQFMSSIFDVLQGDGAALLEAYVVDLSVIEGPPAEQSWRLTLVPRSAPLNTFIESMVIQGRGLTLESTHIIEHGGNERLLVYSNVVLNPVYGEGELERLFSVPSPQ